MQPHCHRCGGDFSPGQDTSFCPHCGAPQLYLPDYGESVITATGPVFTSVSQQPLNLRPIDWKAAIRCAALVTAVAVLLCIASIGFPFISLLGVCWVLSASMTTLALYQHRRPVALMNPRIGARIGLTTGLLLIAGIGLALAVAGLIARFGTHSMGQFDVDLAAYWAANRAKISSSGAQYTEMLRIFDLPEFRAGMLLAGIGFEAAIILVLSVLGGALGGFLRTRRVPAA
jgi:hypothetical protein